MVQERKRWHDALALRVIECASTLDSADDVQLLLQAIVAETGLAFGAIRVRQADDFPIIASHGLPSAFVDAERSLLVRRPDGCPQVDGGGRPALACICGAVLRREATHAPGAHTPDGGFLANNVQTQLSAIDRVRLPNVRARCVAEGFATLALIPIRHGGQMLGLLHLSDPRAEMLDVGDVELLERIGAAIGAAIARRQAEEIATKEATRTRILLDLHEWADKLTDSELGDYVLEQMIRLTDSQIGFLHFLSEDGKSIRFSSFGAQTLQSCTATPEHSLESAGSWADCLRLRRPVVHNDFASTPNRSGLPTGLPSGHVEVRRLVSVPVFEGKSPRIVFGVGNKAQPYEDRDVQHLQLVANELNKVAKQRRVEEELRRSEARYRLMAESAGDVIWTLDMKTRRLRYVSPSIEKLRGYTVQEALAEPLEAAFTPESYRLVLETLANWEEARLDGDGAARTATYRVDQLRKDGTVVPTEVVTTLLVDASGRPIEVVGVSRDITERRRSEAALANENLYLREEVKELQGSAVVGAAGGLRATVERVEQVAPMDATVLLQGETGTGKGLLAVAIHERSTRRERPLVRVECAALATPLIESELFGHERGAYTGAVSRQIGRFELASGSTIFLDEIGELPLEVQAKLLHVLEERRVERLGSPRPIHVDVRVIAATNADLAAEVRAGRFRKDLFYRLNVFPITVPPLRDHIDDLPDLVWAFVTEFGRSMRKHIQAIPAGDLEALRAYSWPGNVRELRNVVERGMILASGPTLRLSPPGRALGDGGGVGKPDAGPGREEILRALERCGWRVRGPNGAANVLGMKPTTLETRMIRLGIRRPGTSG